MLKGTKCAEGNEIVGNRLSIVLQLSPVERENAVIWRNELRCHIEFKRF